MTVQPHNPEDNTAPSDESRAKATDVFYGLDNGRCPDCKRTVERVERDRLRSTTFQPCGHSPAARRLERQEPGSEELATGGIVTGNPLGWLVDSYDRICPSTYWTETARDQITTGGDITVSSTDPSYQRILELFRDMPRPPELPAAVRLNPAEALPTKPQPSYGLDALLGTPVIPDERVTPGYYREDEYSPYRFEGEAQTLRRQWILTGQWGRPPSENDRDGLNPAGMDSAGDDGAGALTGDHNKAEPNLPWPCGIVAIVVGAAAILGTAGLVTLAAMLGWLG